MVFVYQYLETTFIVIVNHTEKGISQKNCKYFQLQYDRKVYLENVEIFNQIVLPILFIKFLKLDLFILFLFFLNKIVVL